MRRAALRKTISWASNSIAIVAILSTGQGPTPLERGTSSLQVCRKTLKVKLSGFFGVFIKPEERLKLVHGRHGSRQGGH